MTRAVPEWQGKTSDTAVPVRVRIRVWERAGGHCHRCNRKLGPGDVWTLEHVQALINGGANAEHNLDVTCFWCFPIKNAEDVAQKAKNASVKAGHVGVRESRNPLPGGRKSKWKKKLDGTVERRE